MKKNYVLDTNVLIHCPDAIYKFEDNNVFLCPQVIEELNRHKKDFGETGYNVREAFRHIDSFLKNRDDLNNIPLPNGGKLFLNYIAPKNIKPQKIYDINADPDNRIIDFTYKLMTAAAASAETFFGTEEGRANADEADCQNGAGSESIPDEEKLPERTIHVTNDTGMKIKAISVVIPVEEYRNDRIADVSKIYTGRDIVQVKDSSIEKFFKEGAIKSKETHTENQFVRLIGKSGGSALSKYKNGKFRELNYINEQPCGLIPRNEFQRFLQESCMTPQSEIPLTICNGSAGTGKTLIALACGLEQVMERHIYKRILLCRPNAFMDNDIGFLPGSEQDKIMPLLRGAYDNLEIIFGNDYDTKDTLQDKIDELFQRGYIKAEAVGYLRGRSITKTFIIIDETQNTTPTQILSIITRAGEGSKIILIGDIDQIDLPRLDKGNNGLSFAIEKMKGSPLADVIMAEAKESVRSPLAKEASGRMIL